MNITEIESKHFWYRGRQMIILNALKRNIPYLDKAKMFEIGCGNGNVMAYLKKNGVNIKGGDISIEALSNCQQLVGDMALCQVDILSLPFRNEFDIIGVFDVLEHVEDDNKALTEIGQALKPNGILILTVPANKFMWSYFDEHAKHKRRYSRKEIVTKLERNNFTIKYLSFFVFFLFPLLATLRIIDRHSKANEFKVIPVVNSVFLWLLYLEKWLMKYVSLPFGSSLLVVVEKKGGQV